MPHFAAATRLVSSAFGGFLRNKKMAPKTNHAKKTRTRVTTPTMSILIRSPEKRYAEKPRKIAGSPVNSQRQCGKSFDQSVTVALNFIRQRYPHFTPRILPPR